MLAGRQVICAISQVTNREHAASALTLWTWCLSSQVTKQANMVMPEALLMFCVIYSYICLNKNDN